MTFVGSALLFRVARWPCRRFTLVIVLALVVAVVGAAVLAMAAGARRTSTAPDRYTRANDTGFAVTGMQDSGRPRTAELATLAGVRRARSMSFVFGGITRRGADEFLDSLVFAGSHEVSGSRLVGGRAPNPERRDEFVVSRTFAEAHGLALGDEVTLHTLTQDDADVFGFDPQHVNGPQVDAVLVGLLDAPVLPGGSSEAITVFSPALLADEVIGTSGTVIGLELDEGVSLADLRAQLGALPEPEVFTLEAAALVSAEARTAVRGQSVGLWVLAGIAAAVAIVAIGQLLARSVRLAPDEVSALSALGYSRRQLLGESSLRAAIVVVSGLVLAVAGAMSASGLFPFGFTRPLEPDPGVRAETVVLLLGVLLLVIGLVGWVALMTRPQQAASSASGSSTLTAVAGRCPTPTMATGVRFALNAGGTPHPAAAAVAGTALFIAALVGTLTFAVSVRRLVDEPARYGANFDAMVDNGGSELPPGLVEMLENQPDVSAFTLYTASQARVDDVTIAVAGMSPVYGDLTPPVLSGRLPRSADEAALGRRSARELGASIGEEITLTSANGSGVYRVTGLVVPPGLRGNDIVGRGAVITSDGIGRLFPGAVPNAVAIDVDGAAPPEQIAARIAELAGVFYDGDGPNRPPAIISLGRITFVPFALAVLLAVLVALLVTNIVYTGVRRRDTPVAVLRALGADRPWILRATLWQALAATIVPAAIGIPLGLVAGRQAFRLLAENLGTVSNAATPAPLTAGAVATFIGLAMLAATVAGRPIRRSQPARLLRAG
jgi:ABC-type antimicrobial peptide transport system permease subunit